MNQNSIQELIQQRQSGNGSQAPARKSQALGRTTSDILKSDNDFENKVGVRKKPMAALNFSDSPNEKHIVQSRCQTIPEHVRAARIGAEILEIISAVSPRYHAVIFDSVEAYRLAAQSETPEPVKEWHVEDKPPPRRRWFGWLFGLGRGA